MSKYTSGILFLATVTHGSQILDWSCGLSRAIQGYERLKSDPMKAIFAYVVILATWFGVLPATAQDRQVTVIELFTSQGCSYCPPADAFLRKLAEHDDLLPLALHVDYWDYIGWKDTFAQSVFTKRQKAYAHGFRAGSVYTPQMIVAGLDHAVGRDVMKIMDMLHHHRMQAKKLQLQVDRRAGGAQLSVQKLSGWALPATILIQLVHFLPEATVSVGRGENAGRVLPSTNVVTRIIALARWDGEKSVKIDLPLPLVPQGQRAAIIVQAATDKGYPGEILGALSLQEQS